uniref:uncharacterized protein LOC128930737 n=1 Tax=Callithrix jacchus TaxID=9483 RepID=UPI0023DCFEB3|nr:uncharacterized protein LOC128930737 [Callithrix jacchus]
MAELWRRGGRWVRACPRAEEGRRRPVRARVDLQTCYLRLSIGNLAIYTRRPRPAPRAPPVWSNYGCLGSEADARRDRGVSPTLPKAGNWDSCHFITVWRPLKEVQRGEERRARRLDLSKNRPPPTHLSKGGEGEGTGARRDPGFGKLEAAARVSTEGWRTRRRPRRNTGSAGDMESARRTPTPSEKKERGPVSPNLDPSAEDPRGRLPGLQRPQKGARIPGRRVSCRPGRFYQTPADPGSRPPPPLSAALTPRRGPVDLMNDTSGLISLRLTWESLAAAGGGTVPGTGRGTGARALLGLTDADCMGLRSSPHSTGPAVRCSPPCVHVSSLSNAHL